MMMTTMMVMNVDDDYDYDDDDYDDDLGYDDDDYDDDDYGEDDYDGAIVGSMLQVVEAATNTAACNLASAADPRRSATNPWLRPMTNPPRTV